MADAQALPQYTAAPPPADEQQQQHRQGEDAVEETTPRPTMPDQSAAIRQQRLEESRENRLAARRQRPNMVEYGARIVLRFLQFIAAITLAGIYANDLRHATNLDPKLIVAEIISGLSALTCILYAVPVIKEWAFFPLDWLLCILWTAIFGVYGKTFLHTHAYDVRTHTFRMQIVTWINLASFLLWLMSAGYSTTLFCLRSCHRRPRRRGMRQPRARGMQQPTDYDMEQPMDYGMQQPMEDVTQQPERVHVPGGIPDEDIV